MRFMQRSIISFASLQECAGGFRRPTGLGLLWLCLAACLLPLAGCEGFPWDKKPQPQVMGTAVLDGPSVTRGRPNTPAPVTKPKTKSKTKKVPVNPATPPITAPGQATTGPEIAAAPGQPVATNTTTPPVGDGATGDTTPGNPGQPAPDSANSDLANSTPSSINPSTTSPSTTNQPATDQTAAAPANSNQIASLPASTSPDHQIAGRPNDMIGRDENGIRALIGAPTKTRTEGSTTVWSYQKDGCALDLFLFYDVKTGAQRVLSYEIKPNATDNNAIQACYDKFHNV